MINHYLAIKQHMTQVFTASGKLVPATVLKAEPCVVAQIQKQTQQIQLGTGQKRKLSKPVKHHLLKHNVKQNLRYLKSFHLAADQIEQLSPGQTITADQVFQVGDIINVRAVSKGKGFAGVVKRHGFAGGPKTHGQSDRHRAPGSIGAGTTPGRVLKGKKMAGRMGGQQVHVMRLKVIAVDGPNNRLVVSGSIPGSRDTLVVIHKIDHQDHWAEEFQSAADQIFANKPDQSEATADDQTKPDSQDQKSAESAEEESQTQPESQDSKSTSKSKGKK